MAEFPLLALRRRLCVEFAFEFESLLSSESLISICSRFPLLALRRRVCLEFALLLRLRLPVKVLSAESFISICSRDFRGLNSSVDIVQDGAYFDPGNRKRFL